MLPRQPLRFLLADPGAGKTIMAGLLIKELIIRGDLERCLVVAPGSLTEQWQDELADKFDLDFELFSRDMVTAARGRNPFAGRAVDADTVTLTKNEILCALNVPTRFRLAVVVVDGDHASEPVYVSGFDYGQPGFAQTAASYDLAKLLADGTPPH